MRLGSRRPRRSPSPVGAVCAPLRRFGTAGPCDGRLTRYAARSEGQETALPSQLLAQSTGNPCNDRADARFDRPQRTA